MRNDDFELLLRSFDEELGALEQARVAALVEESDDARREQARLRRMREMISDGAASGFDPHFADRVLAGVAAVETRNAPQHPTRRATRHSTTPATPRASREATRRSSRRPAHSGRSSRRRPRPERALPSWPVAVGAVTALLVAVGVIWWLQPRTTSVPAGDSEVVALWDGSRIELSGGSTLRYRPFLGRSQRRVELDGEAFFNVTADEKPFVVETFNADVTVLGTAFNVRAWKSDPGQETEVAVESGLVAVSPRAAYDAADEAQDGTQSQERSDSEEQLQTQEQLRTAPEDAAGSTRRVVVLEPGQAISISGALATEPYTASLDHVLAWRNGGIAFLDEPLGTVFRSIERRFGVRVEILDPAISERLLTYMNPRPGSATAVLADICHTLDLRYRRTANGFEILTSETASSSRNE